MERGYAKPASECKKASDVEDTASQQSTGLGSVNSAYGLANLVSQGGSLTTFSGAAAEPRGRFP
jgi:hypothetical protein